MSVREMIAEARAIAPVRPRPYRLAVDEILADIPTVHIAKVMNVTDRTVQRWRLKGVDGFTGDKLAVKVIGKDPYAVWGRDFDRAMEMVDDLDLEPERLSA